jgi:hypothetical protein
MRGIIFDDDSVIVKKRKWQISALKLTKIDVFVSDPKSPTQKGSLSVYNLVVNISHLSTFKQIPCSIQYIPYIACMKLF